jgi:uncharacterized protein (DUF488 family)
MSEAATLRIFTIGHSNHSIDRLLDLLRLHGVGVLVDTRSRPYSKFVPHFNHEALRQSVVAAGFQYLYLGRELGGRPDDNDFYDRDGRVLYERLAESDSFRQALARLVRGIETYRVAILCTEEDPRNCHRRLLITRELRKLSVEVDHVRGDGRVESERDLEAEELASRPQISLFTEASHRV